MNLPKHEVLSVITKRLENSDTGAQRLFKTEVLAELKNGKGKLMKGRLTSAV